MDEGFTPLRSFKDSLNEYMELELNKYWSIIIIKSFYGVRQSFLLLYSLF
jgi:hypothetical protein